MSEKDNGLGQDWDLNLGSLAIRQVLYQFKAPQDRQSYHTLASIFHWLTYTHIFVIACSLPLLFWFIHASYSSLQDVLKTLQKQLQDERFTMIIRRGHVLADSLQRMTRISFSPTKKIRVMD